MSSINQLASDMQRIFANSNKRITGPYDTEAKVVKVEDDIAYVHIPGGVDETPVRKTVDVKVGDSVLARFSGGSGWIIGNETAPATDNTVANQAMEQARKAYVYSKEVKNMAENGEFDGDDGLNGANTAIVYLYKRAEEVTPDPEEETESTTTEYEDVEIDWTEDLEYCFSEHSLSEIPEGWSDSPVSGDGPLYITSAVVYSYEDTVTIEYTEWGVPTILASNGTDGSNGSNNATIYLYQRGSTTPSKPASSLIYTFATGVLSGELGGWVQYIPMGSGSIYVTTAQAISENPTCQINSSDWANVSVLSTDGSGKEVSDIYQMWNMSTSNSTFIQAVGYTWTVTPPSYSSGLYIWTKLVTEYADGTSSESDPYFDIIAQSSGESLYIARATNAHFWYDSNGAHVGETDGDINTGFSNTVSPGGEILRFNGKIIKSQTGSTTTYYDQQGNVLAIYSSNGEQLYSAGKLGMSLTPNSLAFYNNNNQTIFKIGRGMSASSKTENFVTNVVWNVGQTKTNTLIFNLGDVPRNTPTMTITVTCMTSGVDGGVTSKTTSYNSTSHTITATITATPTGSVGSCDMQVVVTATYTPTTTSTSVAIGAGVEPDASYPLNVDNVMKVSTGGYVNAAGGYQVNGSPLIIQTPHYFYPSTGVSVAPGECIDLSASLNLRSGYSSLPARGYRCVGMTGIASDFDVVSFYYNTEYNTINARVRNMTKSTYSGTNQMGFHLIWVKTGCSALDTTTYYESSISSTYRFSSTSKRSDTSPFVQPGSFIIANTSSKSFGSLDANKTKSVTIDASKSGYTFLGVVGYNLSGDGCSVFNVFELYNSGNTINAAVRNMGSAAHTISIVVSCLYVKS